MPARRYPQTSCSVSRAVSLWPVGDAGQQGPEPVRPPVRLHSPVGTPGGRRWPVLLPAPKDRVATARGWAHCPAASGSRFCFPHPAGVRFPLTQRLSETGPLLHFWAVPGPHLPAAGRGSSIHPPRLRLGKGRKELVSRKVSITRQRWVKGKINHLSSFRK